MNKIKRYFEENTGFKCFLSLSSLYFLSYMFIGIPATYLPLFLSSKGLSPAAIGILLSLAPFSVITGQLFWGNIADKSKSKTNVLRITIIIVALISPLFLLSQTFFAFFVLIILLFFCQSPLMPLSDAITFECVPLYGIKYNPIRFIGTFGFALMAFIAGIIATKSINVIFVIYTVTALITLVPAFFSPNVSGHRRQGKKFNPMKMFLKKEYLSLFSYSMIMNITYGFHFSFFSIYFSKTLGTGTALLGFVTLISTILEYPFLLFADKFLRKFSIKPALIIFGCLNLIRWTIYAFTANIPLIIIGSIFQGITLVGYNYYISYYIAKSAPPEGKATSQMINAVLNGGVARVIGSLIGGFMLPLLGMQKIYLLSTILMLLSIIIFSLTKINYKEISSN